MTEPTKNLTLFVGTYTRQEPHLVSANGEGVYVYELDLATGEIDYLSKIGGIVNPSYLAVDAVRNRLFAVSEIGENEVGGVSAYAIDPSTKALSHLNTQQAQGTAACYISADPAGRFVLTANYGTGNVLMLPTPADSGLGSASDMAQHVGQGPNVDRQEGPHAHSVVIDPTGNYAFAADLGADKIFGYKIDAAAGKLIPHESLSLEAGSGPRHLVFHPNGQLAYLIQELDQKITAMRYDRSNGSFEIIETVSTLPDDFDGVSHCADIHLSPSGEFLYGSNRGHDSIVIYAVDGATGRLTLVGFESTQGEIPRNFVIDPTGTFLLVANQNSDTVVTFRIDPKTGELRPTGHVAQVPTPVCLKIADL